VVSESAIEEEWTRLAESLATVLSRLPAGAALIIDAAGNRYAQFGQSDAELHAEISSNFSIDEQWRLTPAQEEMLVELGWAAPSGEETDYVNWYRDLSWPTPTSSYRDLAGAVVGGLQALGVHSPVELKVQGWVDGPGELDLAPLGLEAAR
jgi:hypothetical protein